MSKRFFLSLVFFVLVVFCCSGVSASFVPQSQYLISDMWSGVSPSSSGNLRLQGNTYSFSIVDEISVTVYLQRWTGSSWIDIGNPSISTQFNSRRATVFSERIGVQNNYYRTRSIHVAKIGSSTETKYFYSNPYYYQ